MSYSRPLDGLRDSVFSEEAWTHHASGMLVPGEPVQATEFAQEAWPPQGAEALDVESLYDRLAEVGYGYGLVFQGLQAAWRRGEYLFAEVALDEVQAREAERFCAHPALFDAAFHVMLQAAFADKGDQARPQLPFTYTGVRLHQTGAASWRVRIAPVNGAINLEALDQNGQVMISVDSATARPIEPGKLEGYAKLRDMLFELQWVAPVETSSADTSPEVATLGEIEIPTMEAKRYSDLAELTGAIAEGAPVPDVVLVSGCSTLGTQAVGGELVAEARERAHEALELVKAFLAGNCFVNSRLVFVTERALATSVQEAPALCQAPLVGLIRSARSEYPERFALLDGDGTEASWAGLASALEVGEPEAALREGRLLCPRLSRLGSEDSEQTPAPVDADATVLITGGTGTLGALLALHIASAHGARHLLLTSRRGPAADGAEALRAELEKLGCEVRIVACDISERKEVAALLDSISKEHPLGGVIHAAGVVDNGLITSLDGERLDRVLAPKLDGTIHLHELTDGLDLSLFVLFSSVAATWGGPGQANYAAANAFLDALAQHRRASGLAAHAIAWGPWADATTVAGDPSEEGAVRLLNQIRAHMAMVPLSTEQGLDLFDTARATSLPLLVAGSFDTAALRAQAKAGMLPPFMGSLVRIPARRGLQLTGAWQRRLAETAEPDREALVLELVRSHVAAVLGHVSGEEIEPDRPFKELGFDSLSAVELRNRLANATELRLSATLVFDYPSCTAVASFLRKHAEGERPDVRAVVRRPAALNEPIAIVGMSCRYPGGVRSPEELWRLVDSGGDAIGQFPDDRGWDLERIYDPDPDHPGTCSTREGGFVRDVTGFDAAFFSISPREALEMDPHQRLFLEGAWEALENAGIDPEKLRGSQTGVFAGVMTYDYGIGSAPAGLEGFGTASLGGGVISGRVAYTFGLEGPTVTVDTACSSSLVALHLACQTLRQGECELALAGGVTVLSTPGMFFYFSRQRGLAHDGRCKSFAASADGAGFSDGVGLVVVERLTDAQRAGHRVLAVVRGSAINHDGASNGLTAPNGPSQERVIAQALANARLSPEEVDVVEAHGTGTTLGDPIEAQAIIATYGRKRRSGPLRLGSIKSNIGHTQGAAGIAGVIKMVEAMRHCVLPKSLHADEPTSHVDWSEGAVSLLSESEPWPENGHPRRAGVSSFGASGTNAHVILEQAPEPRESKQSPAVPGLPAVPVLLSAKSQVALRAQAEHLKLHLQLHPELSLADVAFSLATSRAQLEQRAAVVVTERDELLAGLEALQSGTGAENLMEGVAVRKGKTAFMFTGQGAQRPGMGAELYDSFPAFAEAFDHACAELDPHLGRSLRELMFATEGSPEASLIDKTEFTQPALFVLEVALFRLAESWDVKPDFLIGHSIGELSAAHVAGVLSLQDAATLVAARGSLMGSLSEDGAMLAVEATEEELAADLNGFEDRLALAAVNGPTSVVVSGDADAIDDLEVDWAAKQRRTTRLTVSHAFHSSQMEPILEEFRKVAQSLSFESPRVPIVSNVSGQQIADEEITNPDYWVRHVRETVRFADGIVTLEGAGVTRFLEFGPDGVLSTMARQCLSVEAEERSLLVSALRTRSAESEALAGMLAAAHADGMHVAWQAVFAGRGAKQVSLPTYAFQRERYWLGPQPGTGDLTAAGLAIADHPLLGAAVQLAGGQGWAFTSRLSLETHPWLSDHAVMGTVLLPGTAFLELALHAGGQIGCGHVAELVLEVPLVLPEHDAVQLQVFVGELESGQRPLAIYSRVEEPSDGPFSDGEWRRHATGLLTPSDVLKARLTSFDERTTAVQERARVLTGESWPPEGAEAVGVDGLYDASARMGLEYGPAFQGLRAAWRRGEEVFAEVSLCDDHQSEAGSFGVHPALLDSALHASGLGLPSADSDNNAKRSGMRLPFSFNDVKLYASGASSLRISLSQSATGTVSLVVADEAGELVASIDSLVVREVTAAQLGDARDTPRDSLFSMDWTALPVAPESPLGDMVVLGAEGSQLAESLAATGCSVEVHADLESLGEVLDGGASVPGVVFADCGVGTAVGADGLPGTAREILCRVLSLIQAWLSDERFSARRMVFLTQGAVAARLDDEVSNLAAAPLWGLVRSAQSEHPERFVLVDVNGLESFGVLGAALNTDEPQLALREGGILVPRLVRVKSRTSDDQPVLSGEGTVLITGGLGGLGGLLARHLVVEHQVSHLLLIGRRGLETEGAQELKSELEELGGQVTVAACDVADREQLKLLLGSIPNEYPLSAVVHAAGVFDNVIVDSLTPAKIDRVLAPKLDAGLNLHELTEHSDLEAFVLFSSMAGIFGGPGQGNYAAGNAFLDALAAHRRSRGLVATSMAWPLWMDVGAGRHLGEIDMRRMAGTSSFATLSPEEGLARFDQALATGDAMVIPAHLDRRVLRVEARTGVLPTLLRGLAPTSLRRLGDAASSASLARRLANVTEAERGGVVLELVRVQVAAALGHASPEAIDTQSAFKALGFDSLAAIDLRNRLNRATGLRLPATLVFDYPTPGAVAEYLLGEVAQNGATNGIPGDAELDKLELILSSIASDDTERTRIAARLQALLSSLGGPSIDEDADNINDDAIDSATDDELFELVDREME